MSFERLPQEIVNYIALFVSDPNAFSLICKRTRESGQRALFRHISLTDNFKLWQRLQFTSNMADHVRSVYIDASYFRRLIDPSSYVRERNDVDLVALERLSQSLALLRLLTVLKIHSDSFYFISRLSMSNLTYLSLEYATLPAVIYIVNRATRLERLEIWHYVREHENRRFQDANNLHDDASIRPTILHLAFGVGELEHLGPIKQLLASCPDLSSLSIMHAHALSRIPGPDPDPLDMLEHMDDQVEYDDLEDEDDFGPIEQAANVNELEDDDAVGFFIDEHLERLASLRNLMISGVSASSIHKSLSSLTLTTLWIFDFAEEHVQMFTGLRHLRVTAPISKARADLLFECLPNLQTFSSSDWSKANWIKAYGTWELNLVPFDLTHSEQRFMANMVLSYCSNQAVGLRVFTRKSVKFKLDEVFWNDDLYGHRLAKCLDTLDLGFEIDAEYCSKLLLAIPSLRVIRTWKGISNNGRDAWQTFYQRKWDRLEIDWRGMR